MNTIPKEEGMVAAQTFVLLSYINKLIEQGHILIVDGKLSASEEIKSDKRFSGLIK